MKASSWRRSPMPGWKAASIWATAAASLGQAARGSASNQAPPEATDGQQAPQQWEACKRPGDGPPGY